MSGWLSASCIKTLFQLLKRLLKCTSDPARVISFSFKVVWMILFTELHSFIHMFLKNIHFWHRDTKASSTVNCILTKKKKSWYEDYWWSKSLYMQFKWHTSVSICIQFPCMFASFIWFLPCLAFQVVLWNWRFLYFPWDIMCEVMEKSTQPPVALSNVKTPPMFLAVSSSLLSYTEKCPGYFALL